MRSEGAGREPGAAAEIDRAFEERRLLRGSAHRQHRLEQQRRTAITEIADQRRLEARRILIEQRLHIARRHRTDGLDAELHQMQAGAVTVLGIGVTRGTERCDRGVTLAELEPDLAQRVPGRREVRHQLDRLFEQLGSGRQVALQLQVARKLVAAVGNEVARGQKQAGSHFL